MKLKVFLKKKNFQLDPFVIIIFFLIIFFIGLFINRSYNYLTRLNTSYWCVEKTNSSKIILRFDYPWQRIMSENDWISDKVSNYDEDDWNEVGNDKLGNIIVYYYKRPRSSWKLKHKFKSKDGKIYNIPISFYRTEQFNKKNNTLKVYEYLGSEHYSSEYLENNNIDKFSFKINLKLKKEYKCMEDKELEKGFIKLEKDFKKTLK